MRAINYGESVIGGINMHHIRKRAYAALDSEYLKSETQRMSNAC